MNHLEVATVQNLQKFDSFALNASVKCKQQANYTFISIAFGIFLLLQFIFGYPTYEHSVFFAIVILVGIISLAILTNQMTTAEESLREFRILLQSYMSLDSDGGCNLTSSEMNELKSFIRKSTKFMITYAMVRTINWIVFIFAALLILSAVMQIVTYFL